VFRATYRLQLGPGLGFAEAAALVPYLRDLGISHLYLSPAFAARPGSAHGYDVVDPARFSDALGGEHGFRALAAAARDAGLGIVLDIVPNHMAADGANPYWADEQRRTKFFDIDAETGRHRRFFDIDHLAGVRQEDPVVFVETHKLALTVVRQGLVDGLRVDHPDGLADPAGYLERLRDAGVEHVWVEKILDPGERLRDWPVEGTVGYEFLNDVCALFVDPAGERPLTELWAELSGDARPFGEWAAEAKLEQARTTFAPDVDWLRRLWPGVEGLEEALAALPVYRTYIRGLPASEDLHVLREAGLTEWLAQAPREFVTRFQQLTPPIMAKGVEDTAFYRYARLLALCDVGGDPSRWSIDVASFHAGNAERAERFPLHLLASTTHDTKRSGDVRARIAALAGMAEEWAAAVRRWRSLCAPLRDAGAPDAVEEYTIFQTLAGAWPLPPERLCEYMTKALREAKRNTSWVDQDAAWEERVLAYCRALYEHEPFRADFEPFAERLSRAAEPIALRQTALKLTVPGVPDIYQGDELVALSLVDPDNRRPVDWERRRALLGAPPSDPDTRKLWLIRELLALRARRPDAFNGSYEPLDAGPQTVAFARGGEIVVALPVRGEPEFSPPPGDWKEVVALAGVTVLERA
jgi:(1->4)-alpha-D-glucan 1-alpha-D-glucosylmutase